MTRGNDDRDRGFVLISALWAAMILAALSLAVLWMVREQAHIARNVATGWLLRETADAGLHWAAAKAANADLERFAPDAARPGALYAPLVLDGRQVSVTLSLERGRLALNQASEEQLIALLEAAGEQTLAARRLAAAILDWRDADDLARLNGAEASGYRSAGLAYTPRNGDFGAPEELAQVLGMTPALLEQIRDSVTVYPVEGRLDERFAPALVHAALAELGATPVPEGANSAAAMRNAASARGALIRIVAYCCEGARFPIAREAVLRLTDRAEDPFLIYHWADSMQPTTKPRSERP